MLMVCSSLQETLLDPLWGEDESAATLEGQKLPKQSKLQRSIEGSADEAGNHAEKTQAISLGFSDGDDQWQPGKGSLLSDHPDKPPEEPEPADSEATEEGLVPETLPDLPAIETASAQEGETTHLIQKFLSKSLFLHFIILLQMGDPQQGLAGQSSLQALMKDCCLAGKEGQHQNVAVKVWIIVAISAAPFKIAKQEEELATEKSNVIVCMVLKSHVS